MTCKRLQLYPSLEEAIPSFFCLFPFVMSVPFPFTCIVYAPEPLFRIILNKVQNLYLTFFGKLADTVNEYVTKGQQLYVEGRISYSKYTDKEGNERHGTSIIAGMMQMGSSMNGDASAPSSVEDDSLPF